MRARISSILYRVCTLLTRAIVGSLSRLEVVGRELVPRDVPVILVANHVHLLDPPPR